MGCWVQIKAVSRTRLASVVFMGCGFKNREENWLESFQKPMAGFNETQFNCN
jgi:hypothetical protein